MSNTTPSVEIQGDPSTVLSGPHLTGRVEIISAVILTAAWAAFLVFGPFLSAFPAGVEVTDKFFEPPGTVIDGKVLLLGTGHRGSDFFSDLISATWFNTWVCFLSTALSMLAAWPLSRVLFSDSVIPRVGAKLFIRTLFAMMVFPLMILLSVTGYFYEYRPVSLVLVLATFALPFSVLYFAKMRMMPAPHRVGFRQTFVFFLRRAAAIHMLVGFLGFMWWLRDVWPGSLTDIVRLHVTLIAYGDIFPLIPAGIIIIMALTLRLWVSVLEDRYSLFVIPIADAWTFLPTVLEDALDEWRARGEVDTTSEK